MRCENIWTVQTASSN